MRLTWLSRSVLSVICIIAPLTLWAESHSIAGVSFPVEELRSGPGELVTVRMNGESRMIASSDLDSYVLVHSLDTPDKIRGFEADSLIRVYESLLGRNLSAEPLSILLLSLSLHPGCDTRCFSDELERLQKYSEPSEVLRSVIESENFRLVPSPKRFRTLLLSARLDGAWLSEHRQRIDLIATEEGVATLPQLLAEALEGGRTDMFESLKTAASVLFTGKDLKKIEGSAAALQQAAAAAEGADIDALYPILDSSRTDQELSGLISPFVIKALHKRARQEIAQGKAESALMLLTSVDMQKRTPTTHELVGKSLEKISPSYQPILRDVRVQLMLSTISSKDPAVRARYSEALSSQADFFLEHGRFTEAEETISLVEKLDSQGSVNEPLRKKQIIALLRAGDSQAAHSVMDRTGVNVSLMERIRSRFPANTLWIVAGLLSFGLAIPLIIRMFPQKQPIGYSASSRHAYSYDEQPEVDPLFVRHSTVRDPIMEEYESCLAEFGLLPGASLSEVKSAYRSAVKECHPDARGASGDPGSERFMELTAAYNRILEIDSKHLRASRSDRSEEET